MSPSQERLTADHLLSIARADIAVILGTGLGVMEESIAVERAVPYADIHGFPVSSVKSHSGRLLFGTLGDARVAVMSGDSTCTRGTRPGR